MIVNSKSDQMKLKTPVPMLLAFLFCALLSAQPKEQLIDIRVAPDHLDWTYNIGEEVEFTITVLKNNIPFKGIEIEYTIEPDSGWNSLGILDQGTIVLEDGSVKIKAKKFNKPGFLRCTATLEVDGREYYGYATAGFSPEKIVPTTTLPTDFEAFWKKNKEDLSKIPIDPKLTLLPEKCTDKVNVYQVELSNIQGKIYGILSIPKKTGKFPAILYVPGAGIRPYHGKISEAEEGFITLEIGIHGIPVTYEKSLYDNLFHGALREYWVLNLDDKDKAYYKRVYLGCVRAIDFLEGLDQFNGEHIGVTGGSQGGALSIVTAGLDDRVDYLAVFYPALADLTGFVHNRAGGWPQLFTDNQGNMSKKIETSKYFDVVNFARFIKVPGWYSWGYNDVICPPTSMFAAYNVITANKELKIVPETGHWTYPEQTESRNKWFFNKLR